MLKVEFCVAIDAYCVLAKVPWGVELTDKEGPEMTFVGRYNSKIGDTKGKYTWSAVAQVLLPIWKPITLVRQ